MSVDYQNSILWRGEDPLKRKFKPAYDNTKKTARYWPGKAPAWSEEQKKEANEDKQAEDTRQREKRRRAEAVVLEDGASSRLKRLGGALRSTESASERLLRHRVIHEARVLEASTEEKEVQAKREEEERAKQQGPKLEDLEGEARRPVAELAYDEISGDEADDNELRALRRERAREIALLRRKEEEEVLKEEQEDEAAEADEDADESEEDSDLEEEDPRRAAMLKPVFVSKAHRETVREKELLAKEEEEVEKKQKEKLKERKVESKALLIDEIKRDEEAEQNGVDENNASDIELLDDNDEKNEAEEYELWKIRELRRIKRDKEERLSREKEIEWIMKRRNMTEEERLADDKRLDDASAKRDDVKQFNFLQKYYHRGGFFQDKATTGEEPLYLRDYHEPLEEEKFDKNLLPKAMQLRRGQFGKKGQVKHTHLTDVDTTDFQAAWSQNSRQVQKYQERMAAAKGVNNFDRPSTSRAGSDP